MSWRKNGKRYYEGAKRSARGLVESAYKARRKRGIGNKVGGPGSSQPGPQGLVAARREKKAQGQITDALSGAEASPGVVAVRTLDDRSREIKRAVKVGELARNLSLYTRGFRMQGFDAVEAFGEVEALLAEVCNYLSAEGLPAIVDPGTG